ncbi:MAG: ABC transporter substrate-binding protein [Chloroflexi bacterium]|nr:ABC transporter substrate-binding protein [Chloroflexota bacterium]
MFRAIQPYGRVGYGLWAIAAAVAMILLMSACDELGSEQGLGEVRVENGEAIHIRGLAVLATQAGTPSPTFRAMMMAVEDFGPIKGSPVSIGAGIDSRCTADGGTAAADTVVGDPRVVAVIGPSCSVAVAQAAPILSAAGMTIIAPSATSPSLTSDLAGIAGENHNPGFFRVASNDLYEGRAAARFAFEELGLRNVAAIDDGDPYTSGLTATFAGAFMELGGAVEVSSIAKGETELQALLGQIAGGGPDGLYFPLFALEGEAVIRQSRATPGLENVTLIGGASLLEPDILSLPEAAGLYLPGPDLDYGENANQVTGKSSRQLRTDYENRYGDQPASVYLEHAYDATTLLLATIESVAVADGEDLVIDRAELRKALAATSEFGGIIGTLSCDEFGDCGTGAVQIAHNPDSGAGADIRELPIVYRFAP